MNQQHFTISGMTCVACTKLTAKRIKSMPEVSDVAVDLESKTATVTADRPISLQEINTALLGSQYHAEEYHD